MDPKSTAVIITRVVNGWTIGPWHFNQGDCFAQQFVARTPKELADIVQQWATQQQDMPTEQR